MTHGEENRPEIGDVPGRKQFVPTPEGQSDSSFLSNRKVFSL
jgi:hypothetical protein